MADHMTLDQVTETLDALIDDIEANPEKTVHFKDEQGRGFVLLSHSAYVQMTARMNANALTFPRP